jgi:insulysin
MSEAAMNVLAGSWDEPSTFPGLAHFLEHMLFQGSHTYPQNEYFDQLIESKGGETNAYTENSNTNFYFSVDTDTLERALTVFSHFFIDPMLSDDTVAKEVNAVNSEYEIDVSSDSWKIMNLISLLSDSKHPSSRFTIGNSDTLKQEGVIRALKDFYRNHYSSNQMALVVRTNQNLDKLEEFIA